MARRKSTDTESSVKATVRKTSRAVKNVAKATKDAVEKELPVMEEVIETAKESVKDNVKETTDTLKEKADTLKEMLVPTSKNKIAFVQFAGKEINVDDLYETAADVWAAETGNDKANVKDITLYIKPEENRAYFVIGEYTGSVEL